MVLYPNTHIFNLTLIIPHCEIKVCTVINKTFVHRYVFSTVNDDIVFSKSLLEKALGGCTYQYYDREPNDKAPSILA